MNTVKVRDALDLFLVSVPGCPVQMAGQALLSAAREFCDHTAVHTEPSDRLAAVPGLTLYEFDAPDPELMICRMIRLSHAGTSTRNLVELRSSLNSGEVYGAMVLAPSGQAKSLWEPLVSHYGEALAAGALSKLLSRTGTEFYNPQQSAFEAARFSDWLHNTRMQVEQPSIVQIPQGFL